MLAVQRLSGAEWLGRRVSARDEEPRWDGHTPLKMSAWRAIDRGECSKGKDSQTGVRSIGLGACEVLREGRSGSERISATYTTTRADSLVDRLREMAIQLSIRSNDLICSRFLVTRIVFVEPAWQRIIVT